MAGKITSLSSENVLNQLDAVREAMLNFRYEQASKILELFICLIAINEEVAKYSSIIWAWLGECFFNSDKIKESVQPYQKALNICLAENDISGIWCYLKSLYDIYCYLEDYENAQRICEQIVEFFQKNKKDDPRLAQYQSEARILQKMTRFPLVRVVVQVGKQLFELDGNINNFSFNHCPLIRIQKLILTSVVLTRDFIVTKGKLGQCDNSIQFCPQ